MTTQKHREALFNEIKGSLFEYLFARDLAINWGGEAHFTRGLPPHYLSVLGQQDRMVRELHPQLARLLPLWAKAAGAHFRARFPAATFTGVALTGQLVHTPADLREADLQLEGEAPWSVSLKLNKRAAAVNTKSGGVKSFLTEYFPGPRATELQAHFNVSVDARFAVLHSELHQAAGLAPSPGWTEWARHHSELPGELAPELRAILHRFYAELAAELGGALRELQHSDPARFATDLLRVVGFGRDDLVQVICFHDINGAHPEPVDVRVHTADEARERLAQLRWEESRDVSFTGLALGDWRLHVRIKPMNKFTTTAIKVNCAVKYGEG
jgi:hypothetical protein